VAILKKLGFNGGYADPHVMIQHNKNGLRYVSIYVDDNFCVGHKTALMNFVIELREHDLIIKVAEGLTDYLSCKIVVSEDGERHGLASHTSLRSWKNVLKLVGESAKLQDSRNPWEPCYYSPG